MHNDDEVFLQYAKKNRLPIVRAGQKELFNAPDILHINWVLTRRCNFHCSYCGATSNKEEFMPLEKLKIAIDKIAGLDKSKIKISLLGGEPTFHPQFLEFIDYLLNRVGSHLERLVLITNLSLNNSFYEQFTAHFKDHRQKFRILASYHCESKYQDRYCENIKILADNSFKITCALMAHPKMMPDCRDIYNRLFPLYKDKKEMVRVSLRPIKEKGKLSKQYNAEDINWIKERGHEEKDEERTCFVDFEADKKNREVVFDTHTDFVIYNLNSFKGLKCEIGKSLLAIDEKGFVTYSICTRGDAKYRSNIYKDDLRIKTEPITCNKKYCTCATDWVIPKYKSV